MRAKRAAAIAALVAVTLAGLWLALRPGGELDDEREAAAEVKPRVGQTMKLGSEGQVNSLIFAEGSLWVSSYEVPGRDRVVRGMDPGR